MSVSDELVTACFDGRPLSVTIDLAAFRSNLDQIDKLAPNSKVLVVVKANAYGHGIVEISRAAGDRSLAVAVPEECKVLQDAEIENEIWVLEGPFSSRCLALSEENSVVWVLHSSWQIELLERYVEECKGDETIVVCIKFDTGMHRLGFGVEELEELGGRLARLNCVEIKAVMTHFANSDKKNCEEVKLQIQQFEDALAKSQLQHLPRTLANSGGILYYPDSHQDWVRPGIMLYGGMPSADLDHDVYDLRSVMSLRSRIIAIREISEGEAIGYGSIWRAERKTLVGVVACGYGDGYPRHAKSGTPVVIFDNASTSHTVSLIGRVSMDMLMIDLTDVSWAKVGDRIELWGEHLAADRVACHADTISYTLFCGVTNRVPRFYQGTRLIDS